MIRAKNNQDWFQLMVTTVFSPLTIGTVFYQLFRQEDSNFLGNGMAEYWSILGIIFQSIPSLLWSFSLASALFLIWRPSTKWGTYTVMLSAALTSLFFEAAQAADWVRGTFDWNDCFFSLAGCLLSMVAFQKIWSNEKHD